MCRSAEENVFFISGLKSRETGICAIYFTTAISITQTRIVSLQEVAVMKAARSAIMQSVFTSRCSEENELKTTSEMELERGIAFANSQFSL